MFKRLNRAVFGGFFIFASFFGVETMIFGAETEGQAAEEAAVPGPGSVHSPGRPPQRPTTARNG